MDEPVKHFVTTPEALGGYFFVLAMEPTASFYNLLRGASCDSAAIRWTWFCMLQCFVDLTVQQHSSASKTPSRFDRVLAALIQHSKAIGVGSDEHLRDIEARAELFRKLIRNYLEENLGGSLLMGRAIAGSLPCEVTNPAILFEVGQEFVDLFLQVQQKFQVFDIV